MRSSENVALTSLLSSGECVDALIRLVSATKCKNADELFSKQDFGPILLQPDMEEITACTDYLLT